MRYKEDDGPYRIFAETEKTIEFNELDPMQVVWHGNYIDYFESARRSLLEKIGYDYNEMKKSGYAFPIVEVSIKYITPLKYKDHILIKAVLMEYENRLKIRFEIHNAQTDCIATKGLTTQMAINNKTGESCFVCPQVFIDKVEALIEKENMDGKS